MLTEYLPNDEYHIDLLAAEGKVLYTAGCRNTEMVMSIFQAPILEYNESAKRIAEQIVTTLNLDGNFCFDFKYDDRGNARLLEINPRINVTVSIYAAGGKNIPYHRVKQLLGEKLPEVNVRYETCLKYCYLGNFTDTAGTLLIEDLVII